jgi:hypothetical protein
VTVIHAIGIWNELILATIYLTNDDLYPITRGLIVFEGCTAATGRQAGRRRADADVPDARAVHVPPALHHLRPDCGCGQGMTTVSPSIHMVRLTVDSA